MDGVAEFLIAIGAGKSSDERTQKQKSTHITFVAMSAWVIGNPKIFTEIRVQVGKGDGSRTTEKIGISVIVRHVNATITLARAAEFPKKN